MQVVLNKDVKGLGYRGEIVSVKGGYFRNYLLPNGFAGVANAAAMKLAESRKEKILMEKQRLMENSQDVVQKLDGLKVVIKAKASDKGKLYAGIVEEDVIAAVMKEANVRLEKEFLKMDHFKEVGEYKVGVQIGEESTEIDLVVEAE